MRVIYNIYQIFKIIYYAVFFLLFYTVLWGSLLVSLINITSLGYQHLNFLQENSKIQEKILQTEESQDPHWLKIQKINNYSKKEYFFLPQIYSPLKFLFLSIFLLIPAFLVSSFHELVRKILYFLENNLRNFFSHLLEDKEKK